MNRSINAFEGTRRARAQLLALLMALRLGWSSPVLAQPDPAVSQQLLSNGQAVVIHYLEVNQDDQRMAGLQDLDKITLDGDYRKEYAFGPSFLRGDVVGSPEKSVEWHGAWLGTVKHSSRTIGTARILSPVGDRSTYSVSEMWDVGCSRHLQEVWMPRDIIVNHIPENEMFVLRDSTAIALCDWTQLALGADPISLDVLQNYLRSRADAHLPPTDSLSIYLTSMPPIPTSHVTVDASAVLSPDMTAPAGPLSSTPNGLRSGAFDVIGITGFALLLMIGLFARSRRAGR